MIPYAFIEDRDGPLPGQTLGVIDFTQVKDVVLSDLATAVAAGFNDGPRTVDLAVLASGAALEEHEDRLSGFLRRRKEGWSPLHALSGLDCLKTGRFCKIHA